jgi:hypothetical protein
MLVGINKLHGYVIRATDGEIGKVDEFYFDDASWRVRYLVADTGNWLTGRRVLLPVTALGPPSRESHCLTVSLTRKQVEDSPDINTEQPITRRQDEELRRHFGWAYSWAADPLLGDPTFSSTPAPMSAAMALEESPEPHGDPHLESAKDVIGYHIQAVDSEIGHVEDFLVDDRGWVLRYIVVDTGNLLSGKKVLIAPEWVEKIEWTEAKMYVGLTRDRIREAPSFDPTAPITRDYESQLYDYYGGPKYW